MYVCISSHDSFHLSTRLDPAFSLLLLITVTLSKFMIIIFWGSSLVVQQLRLRTPNAGGPGSIPGQGPRSRMPQLKVPHAAMKVLHTATKTQLSQINK